MYLISTNSNFKLDNWNKMCLNKSEARGGLSLVLEEVCCEASWGIWSLASGQVVPCRMAGRSELGLGPIK